MATPDTLLDFVRSSRGLSDRASAVSSGLAAFIAREPALLSRSIAREGTQSVDEEEGVIATLFGVPIGTQFGTAAGLTGVTALAVDILTDPLTYLGGVGALSKTGRAARAAQSARKVNKIGENLAKTGVPLSDALKGRAAMVDLSARVEERSIQQLKGLIEGSSTANASNSLRQTLQTLERGNLADLPFEGFVPGKEIVRSTTQAVRNGGTDAGVQFLDNQIAKRLTIRNRAKDLAQAGNFRDFKKLAKEIRKLEPSARRDVLLGSRALNDFRAAFSLGQQSLPGQRIRNVSDQFRKLDGMKAPQRAGLEFRIPFTEKSIAVSSSSTPFGGLVEKAAERVNKFGKTAESALAIPGVRAAARAASLAKDRPEVLSTPDSVFDIGDVVTRFIRGNPDTERVRDFLGLHKQFTSDAQASRALGLVFEKDLNAWARGGKEGFIQESKRVLGQGARAADDIRPGSAEAARREELGKVFQLVENADDLLVRSKIDPEKLVRTPDGRQFTQGTFGDTQIFGELTEAARAKGITDRHVAMAESLSTLFKNWGDELIRQNVFEKGISDYMPRITTVLKPKEWEAFQQSKKFVDSINGFYRFGAPRKVAKFNDLLELEKKGIIKVEKDPAKILRAYIESSIQATAQGRLVERVAASQVPVPVVAGTTGAKVARDIQDNWAPMMVGKRSKSLEKFRTVEKGGLYQRMDRQRFPGVDAMARKIGIPFGEPVFVHKDSAFQMGRLLEPVKKSDAFSGLMEKAWDKALAVNAAMKRSLLAFSGFHYMALMESAVADLGTAFLRNPRQAIRQGQRDFFMATDLMEDALRSGLQIGPMTDAEIGVVSRSLKLQEKSIPGLSPAARALGRATTVWDRGLWDYYHNGIKLFAFNEIYQRGLSKFGTKNLRLRAQEAARHVNNAFGGQIWEDLMVNRNGQRMARMFIMAPDWTFSNLRIARDVFANRFQKFDQFALTGRWGGFSLSAEEMLDAQNVRKFFARRYALQAGLIWLPMVNMANFAFTGHFMWDNPEGHKEQIQLPWKDENGRQLFMDPGKQFKEPFELFGFMGAKEPILDFLRRKKSRVIDNVSYLSSGRDYFGRPIVHPDSEGSGIKEIADHLGFFVRGNLPIPAQEAIRAAERSEGGLSLRGIAESVPGTLGLPIRRQFSDSATPQGSAPRGGDIEATSDATIPEVIGDAFDLGAGNPILQERRLLQAVAR